VDFERGMGPGSRGSKRPAWPGTQLTFFS